jgi:hypothetical protein
MGDLYVTCVGNYTVVESLGEILEATIVVAFGKLLLCLAFCNLTWLYSFVLSWWHSQFTCAIYFAIYAFVPSQTHVYDSLLPLGWLILPVRFLSGLSTFFQFLFVLSWSSLSCVSFNSGLLLLFCLFVLKPSNVELGLLPYLLFLKSVCTPLCTSVSKTQLLWCVLLCVCGNLVEGNLFTEYATLILI